ncbi:MAG: HEAT repeat domain-containing protein [Chloroflexota bacterium]
MTDLHSLLQQLICGQDDLAEQAARQLTRYGEEAVTPLLELLNSEDSDRRWWALRALADIPSLSSKTALIQGLNDPDPAVRQCAALGLRVQPTFDAVPELIPLLSNADSLLARLAGDALAAVGAQAVPDLLLVMKNGAQSARLEAVRALALIGDPRAIPALFTALGEDSTLMEYWATEGLDRMGVGITYVQP